jgi:hypothetical protein
MRVVAELDVCEDCMVAIDRGAMLDTHINLRESDTFARFGCDRCGKWIAGARYRAATLGR